MPDHAVKPCVPLSSLCPTTAPTTYKPTLPPSHPTTLTATQVAYGDYGEWLDVYLTVLKPLPTPVRGLLGE